MVAGWGAGSRAQQKNEDAADEPGCKKVGCMHRMAVEAQGAGDVAGRKV